MITLPIDSYLDDIVKKILSPSPVILTASPGSGKTTRVPASLLKQIKTNSTKKIIVIVPKRVSALSAADRIAAENNWILGEDVGYQVRFENKTTAKTQLIFMTEGMFLKRIQTSSFWDEIHTLIIDEFHERSSSIDLILGLSYEQKIFGKSLQLVIMSATLNVKQLKSFLGDCHTIEIDTPPHKLEIIFSEKTQKLICDDTFYQNLKDTLIKAWRISKKDVLIFLPGQREILRFRNLIQPLFTQNKIDILHGSLNLAEQKLIVRGHSDSANQRRIILSTNVAESSITVSGVDCVIDSGLEKKSFTEPKVGFSGLDIQRISLFSSQQRAGRAAREQNGHCFKLWHASDELSMKEQIEPEILTSNLIEETLVLYQQDIKDIESFSWLNKPTLLTIRNARQKLLNWSLIDEDNQLTPLAVVISKWPLSIENSILHYKLSAKGFNNQSAKLIATIESGQIEAILEKNKNFSGSDIDKILDSNFLDAKIQRLHQQILSTCKVSITNPTDSTFDKQLIQIFSECFPEKIAYIKNKMNAVSMYGRGLQVASTSNLTSADYYIALTGRENHSQFSQVTCALGFDKKLALEIFSPLAKKTTEVHFDKEKNEFFKTEQLKFETFVLTDFGKSKLNSNELKTNWKTFFKNNFKEFLEIHHNYNSIRIRLDFLLRNDIKVITLSPESKNQIAYFDSLLAHYIFEIYSDFNDFIESDLFYLTYQVLNDQLCDYLQNLPETIKSPRGKTVSINYQDEKAPMISLKIQEAFGWKDTPKICRNQFTLTLELLAPNMRPAQITSKLQHFWKNSYAEVRKDLRARYPKHDWPEDPSL